MKNVKRKNTVERFIYSMNYKLASQSENPNEKCKNCTALFTFKGKTRCYAYEQQVFRDSKHEFNPRRNYNCILYENEHSFENEITAYRNALAKGIDPLNDIDYKNVLQKENNNFHMLQGIPNNRFQKVYEDD